MIEQEIVKSRLKPFGMGMVLGVVASAILLHFALGKMATKEPVKYAIVMAVCDIKANEPLTGSCAEVREVADPYIPPRVLMGEDLEWHIGRKLLVDVAAGSALRVVDFAPVTKEGYIR